MTADLTTLGTGTAAPGSFYGRRGAGPDAALDAAGAVVNALAALNPGRGAPLAAYLVPLTRFRGIARSLAGGLILEGRIASEALTADLSLPEPEAAREVRDRLTAAARGTASVADRIGPAARALERELHTIEDADPGDGGRLIRRATRAADRAADLKAELARASSRPVPASLPMVDGHRQLTDAAVEILAHLWCVCEELDSGITDAYAALGRPAAARAGKVTSPLHQVPADLRRAAKDVTRASAVLAGACAQIRKAPPGFPCASCTGQGTKWSAPCDRCRGGGTDPFAGRQ